MVGYGNGARLFTPCTFYAAYIFVTTGIPFAGGCLDISKGHIIPLDINRDGLINGARWLEVTANNDGGRFAVLTNIRFRKNGDRH